MKRLVLITLLVTSIASAGWFRTYGEEGYDVGNCVQITSDGNYIIAGNKADSMWLLKVDTSGLIIWSKTYEGYANWLEETEDGGFIVCGSPDLMKVTSEGDSVWAQDFGIDAQCVQEADGGYAVTGYTGFYGDTSWLIKTDAVGDSLWSQFYANPEHNRNKTYFLQTTSDEGYIMTGTTEIMTEDFITGYLWLIKTDFEGNVEWTKEYGTGQEADLYSGYCVTKKSGDGFIISGQTDVGGGLWLLNTDPFGDTLWTRNYGEGIGFSVREVEDGGYIIVGTSEDIYLTQSASIGDLWLIKTDTAGDTLWTRQYGGYNTDIGQCVQQTGDEGYIVVGETWSFGVGQTDLYLLKTDSLGLLNIEEKPVIKQPKNWEIVSSLGHETVLRYWDMLQGFNAIVYDVLGREVDSITSSASATTLRWGSGFPSGIYFIQEREHKHIHTERVVIIH